MDWIDIQIEMPEVGYKELTEKAQGEPSKVILARVNGGYITDVSEKRIYLTNMK